jgi:predicted GNAT family acetyltransferase
LENELSVLTVLTEMRTDLTETIVQAENWFPQTFADVEKRDWGVLFVTPTIPDSHDGNHACVLNRCDDLTTVVDEIVDFYESRELTPRVNYISSDGDYIGLIETLEEASFIIENKNTMRLYLHRKPSRIVPEPCINVHLVDTVDDNLLANLISIGNMRMTKVIQRRTRRTDDWLFVGKDNGQVVSVALLERVGNICRVDEVNTAESHRGRGYASCVVHTMVNYYRNHLSEPLYLWTDNPVAERIYSKAGFVKVELSLTSWTAWR